MSDHYGQLLGTVPSEQERLRLLEKSADPVTIAAFERLGVAVGWRCLEVGAGAGSMAAWLADRAGASCVVATDLNIEFLADLTARGVGVVLHDVTTDPAPGEAFDLIHIRHLLVHLPQRLKVRPRDGRHIRDPRSPGRRVQQMPQDNSPQRPPATVRGVTP